MAFFIIVSIIVFVGIYNANNTIKKLQDENQKLKKELMIAKQQLQNQTKAENIENQNTEIAEKVHTQVAQNNFIKEKRPLSEEEIQQIRFKKEKREREARNTTILITGAILIVLSAIVFLMSTWYTIPNVLKTAVLLMLVVVFLGGSKIAKERFKLEKASNTFFYIAMAYIPICLFSISFFGLLGDFLSLNGEGNFIYLTIIGIITAVIYAMIYRKNHSKILFYGSILSQVFSVILFSLIFDNRLELISLNLLLYNILFILLTSQPKNVFGNSVKKVYAVLPYIATFLIYISFENKTILIPVNLIVLAINYLVLEVRENKAIHAYLFNIVINILGIYCFWRTENNLTESAQAVLTFAYFIGVYGLQNILLFGKEKRNLKVACSVVTLIMLQLLFFEIDYIENSFIKTYIISAVQCLILVLSYIQSKEFGKKITSYLVPIYFIITWLAFLIEYKATYHLYIALSLFTFVIGELLQSKKYLTLNKGFFIISNICIGAVYFIIAVAYRSKFIDDVLYFLLLFCIYVYGYLKINKPIFKYLAYGMSYIVMISICDFFGISDDFMYLIPTIMLLVLLNLEDKIDMLKDAGSRVFFAIAKILAYVYLTDLGNEIGTIISIGLTAYFVYYYHKNNENPYGNIIPLIGTMPNIFSSRLDSTLSICIMLLSTIGLTVVAVRKKRINIYTIFSGAYLLFTLDEIYTEFINEILFLSWALCNWYFVQAQKEKDIFKFLSYIGGLLLYNQFVDELELTEYTAFTMLGYIVVIIATIRTILKTYLTKSDIDALEAVFSIGFYLIAITQYNGENDGMLFGILIVFILIISYIKKYGTLFLTSTGAILLNVFLLTRAFWFSIPWWIYLLIIGSVLISFAVKNEANEKKNKLNIGNTLKNIKDKIEQ